MDDTPLTGPNAIQIMKIKMGIQNRGKKKINKDEVMGDKPNNTDIKPIKKIKTHNREPDIMVTILCHFMKKQNKILLHKIALFKNLSEKETEIFVESYLKPNYYTPELKYV
tara:strand:- start:819 stop:1151 length:333 start_codon:yes stop_codon:yes gene_type:complete